VQYFTIIRAFSCEEFYPRKAPIYIGK